MLLIDEIDKADFEFESLLLEVLSDYQVSIPEIGTIVARSKPVVFLTSNDTRDLSDALKRRCLHLHIPFPSVELEQRIVASRVPELQRTPEPTTGALCPRYSRARSQESTGHLRNHRLGRAAYCCFMQKNSTDN